MSELKDVTTAEFERQVTEARGPVVVDFYAPWCAPCQMLAPVLRGMAAKLAGRLRTVKVDVESEPELAMRYGVRGVPTLAFFRDGALVETQVGLIPPDRLYARLEAFAAPQRATAPQA